MSLIINRINSSIYTLQIHTISFGIRLKNTYQWIVGKTVRTVVIILKDVYNLKDEGLEKWTKALIINLKVITIIFKLGEVFNPLQQTLAWQKDLYYGTKILTTPAAFIHVQPTNLSIIERINKVLYVSMNILETSRFLQKCDILQFNYLSKLATHIGQFRILNTTFEKLPIIGDVFNNPKNILVVIVSVIEIFQLRPNLSVQVQLKDFLKVVGCIGKVILIATAKATFKDSLWLVAVDFVTQNSALVKYFMDKYRERIN